MSYTQIQDTSMSITMNGSVLFPLTVTLNGAQDHLMFFFHYLLKDGSSI